MFLMDHKMETKSAAKKSSRKKSASPKTSRKKTGAAPRRVKKLKAVKKEAGALETIGYAAGATVGKLANLAGQTSRVFKDAANKVIVSARKRKPRS